jgi:exportin-2 (importin alpha re-exporter)
LLVPPASEPTDQWRNLLPEMISKFETGDFHIINGVLLSANAIFKRFTGTFKSDPVMLQLKFCLDTFADPLTKLWVLVCGELQVGLQVNNPLDSNQIKECRLIFHHLDRTCVVAILGTESRPQLTVRRIIYMYL